jgi:apolipoprotein N-acyltransferase
LGLLLAGAFVFSLAFPSFASKWGWFPLGFISLIPVFIVVHRSNWAGVFFYGAFYGFVTYSIHNFWLLNFHPLTIFIVPVIYLAYFVAVFPLLKLADSLFPRYGYILQLGIWIGYEYLRLQGYLGYAYGILGYTQFQFIPFIQVADITGVWGVSLLVAFPSAYLGNALKNGTERLTRFLRRHWVDAVAYGLLVVAALVYGFTSQVDYSDSRRWKVAMVQQNIDPWRGGLTAYRQSLDALERQSERALEEHEGIETVIWSETSFVPSIRYHERLRERPESYDLVKRLLRFLDEQPVPYVVGNDDAELNRLPSGELERVDYNASLLFKEGELVEEYRKVHLVPFTEHFPFRDTLPWMYRMLREADTHFWQEGSEYTVFEAAGVKFSTPICFEDTFGYLSRRFVREGAEVIVNMTNDSWAHSVAAAMQHMAMATFRAVENHRSVVRSTNGGMTTSIDPNGRITEILPAFTEDYLVSEVPVYTDTQTFYTRHGNWFPITVMVLSVAALLSGAIVAGIRWYRGD